MVAVTHASVYGAWYARHVAQGTHKVGSSHQRFGVGMANV
jgi:hypothetical protein